MIDIVRASDFHRHPRIKKILSRRESGDSNVDQVVGKIIARVRKEGDRALRELTLQLDAVRLRSIRVPLSQIKKQAGCAPLELRRAIKAACRNIEDFHRRQIEKSWIVPRGFGSMVGQRISPISALGLYVPGGTAAYPSTVLMNAIPARVAGVRRIAVVTPPKSFMTNPGVAAALVELGLDEVYAVGGAQAVAALAYGTESLRPVDKIVGPGNQFVASAKRMVFGKVDIDMIAGPSEVVVVADHTSDPRLIAADMLAQAEHDTHASAICIALSQDLAQAVRNQIEEQIRTLDRKAICRHSMDVYGAVIVARHLGEAESIVNELAPEHLELHLRGAEAFSRKIRNAGAIFLGPYSPEAVGDYFAGPNHVLPTNGTARFSSPLGVYDFLKRTSIIRYSRQRLARDAENIITLARAEHLEAHARSVEFRLCSKPPQRGSGPVRRKDR
jgi:histidinol dehydrogenase